LTSGQTQEPREQHMLQDQRSLQDLVKLLELNHRPEDIRRSTPLSKALLLLGPIIGPRVVETITLHLQSFTARKKLEMLDMMSTQYSVSVRLMDGNTTGAEFRVC